MGARLHRSTVAALLAGAWLIAGAAFPVDASYGARRDLYLPSADERQVDGRTCTAAATATMMNVIAGRDLHLSQPTLLAYEQPRDALRDSVQRGSDPLGWARAATFASRLTGRPTTYAWEAYGSARAALRRAARQIAITRKPVGLLVAHGTHAMVMTGFVASADPARDPSFTLETIWVSDPNGSAHHEYAAGSSPLDRYLETDATPWYDAAWYARYVLIVPQA